MLINFTSLFWHFLNTLRLALFFSRSTFFGTSSVFFSSKWLLYQCSQSFCDGPNLGEAVTWSGNDGFTASLLEFQNRWFDWTLYTPGRLTWKLKMMDQLAVSFREGKWFTYYEPNFRQSPTNPDILGSPTITTGDYQTLHPWKINMETQGMMVGRRLVSFWDGIFSGTSC